MNTHTLTLTSLSSTAVQYLSTIDLIDHTKLTIDISGLDNDFIPLYLKIHWGEGDTELFDNDILYYRNELGNLLFEPILDGTYTHEYYPSETALYKLLSAQVFLKYTNEGFYYALIPIQIKTKDYFESIGDMDLINTNILPTENSPSEHQFKTSADGYIIELRGN